MSGHTVYGGGSYTGKGSYTPPDQTALALARIENLLQQILQALEKKK